MINGNNNDVIIHLFEKIPKLQKKNNIVFVAYSICKQYASYTRNRISFLCKENKHLSYGANIIPKYVNLSAFSKKKSVTIHGISSLTTVDFITLNWL